MKLWRSILIGAVVFWSGVVGAATVEKVVGADGVSVKGGKEEAWKELGGVKVLKAPVWIKTGPGASVELKLSAGSLIRVPERSVVEIEKEAGDRVGEGEVELEVTEGRVLCVANVSDAASKFEVSNNVGVCGGRGAVVVFEATAEGPFRCESGTLVAVYISLSHAPPLVLNGGDQAVPPARGNMEKKERMPKEIAEKLSEEIKTLRVAAGY